MCIGTIEMRMHSAIALGEDDGRTVHTVGRR